MVWPPSGLAAPGDEPAEDHHGADGPGPGDHPYGQTPTRTLRLDPSPLGANAGPREIIRHGKIPSSIGVGDDADRVDRDPQPRQQRRKRRRSGKGPTSL